MRNLVWLIAATIGFSMCNGCAYDRDHHHDDHTDVVVVGHEHEHWNHDHWEHDPDWDQYHH
jgi:hypothetical protein